MNEYKFLFTSKERSFSTSVYAIRLEAAKERAEQIRDLSGFDSCEHIATLLMPESDVQPIITWTPYPLPE